MFHVFSHQIFRLQFGGGIMSTTQRKSLELRSEEHTSELQSQSNLVCRLLLEKKKIDDIRSFILGHNDISTYRSVLEIMHARLRCVSRMAVVRSCSISDALILSLCQQTRFRY